MSKSNWSKYALFFGLVLLLAGVSGCFGGKADLTCDEARLYEQARAGRRIDTPEDLDGLEPLKEIPLPEASPRPPRPEGSPCLDLPPGQLGGSQ